MDPVPFQADMMMMKIEGSDSSVSSNNEETIESNDDESWDHGYVPDPELIGTENPNDAPWFEVEMRVDVVREAAMEDALREVEDEVDLDVPLKFRRFYSELFNKINMRLAEHVTTEMLLIDIPGLPDGEASRRATLHSWETGRHSMVFPVRRGPTSTSIESNSPEY